MNNSIKPIVAYYMLAYFVSLAIWSPYYLSAYPAAWAHMPVFHVAGTYGPLVAAVACTAIFRQKRGESWFTQHLADFRRPWFLLIALLLPATILLFSVLMVYKGNIGKFDWSHLWRNKELGTNNAWAWLALNIGVYGLGEEAGWRGYALPWFQSRYGPLKSSLIVAVLWAVWHWPLFFYQHSGYYTMHIGDITGWLFSIVVGSLILTWIYNGSGGSILACAVFHGMMEIAFTSGERAAEISQYSGMALTIIAAVVTIYALKNKRTKYAAPAQQR